LVALLGDRAKMDRFGLLGEMGGLMLWGTLLLFLDSLMIILLYERLARWQKGHVVLRIWLAAGCVLAFDQIGFFAALHLKFGVPFSAGLGGLLGKLVAAGFYSLLLGAYLRWVEPSPLTAGLQRRIGDVFDALTYRQRYEALRNEAARDSLTGLLHRGRFESLGRELVDLAQHAHRPLSLLLIDVDHFKSVNDQLGHPAGDSVLQAIAQTLSAGVRVDDFVFRYGGEEFTVILAGAEAEPALEIAEHLRLAIAALPPPLAPWPITVSIGVATLPRDGETLAALLLIADKRLYRAKAEGRNRVIGTGTPTP